MIKGDIRIAAQFLNSITPSVRGPSVGLRSPDHSRPSRKIELKQQK
jgi:hypothetical protein